MTTQLLTGQTSWALTRDEDGHREYKVKHQVKADYGDGPAQVLLTPGLPIPGTIWLVQNDVDLWAWCRQNATVTPYMDRENLYFEVEQIFSTKQSKRCSDTQVENPLLEPQKVSGSFVKYVEEAALDLFGREITNSSWEQIHGPQVEFDRSRPTVRIEQNVAVLNLALFTAMQDTVNSFPLWGLPRRCVKLSNATWERKYMGGCFVYYTRIFDFDINFDTFDRVLADEGNLVLNGHFDDSLGVGGEWVLDEIDGAPPDRFNPLHFIQFKDRQGENRRTLLNGFGEPYNPNKITPRFLDDGSDRFAGTGITFPDEDESLGTIATPTGLQVVLREGGPARFDAEYTVTAKNETGETLPSGELHADFTPLVVDGKNIAEITWNPVTGATGYNVFRKDIIGVPEVDDVAIFEFIGSVGDPGFRRPGSINVAKYPESNFLLLGIPTTL